MERPELALSASLDQNRGEIFMKGAALIFHMRERERDVPLAPERCRVWAVIAGAASTWALAARSHSAHHSLMNKTVRSRDLFINESYLFFLNITFDLVLLYLEYCFQFADSFKALHSDVARPSEAAVIVIVMKVELLWLIKLKRNIAPVTASVSSVVFSDSVWFCIRLLLFLSLVAAACIACTKDMLLRVSSWRRHYNWRPSHAYI